ncbi:hypothetical protein NL676_023743 [Syzygium grande]|nr:hypothetical protein NL676_023743 [Syzygium grande]
MRSYNSQEAVSREDPAAGCARRGVGPDPTLTSFSIFAPWGVLQAGAAASLVFTAFSFAIAASVLGVATGAGRGSAVHFDLSPTWSVSSGGRARGSATGSNPDHKRATVCCALAPGGKSVARGGPSMRSSVGTVAVLASLWPVAAASRVATGSGVGVTGVSSSIESGAGGR